MITPPLLFAHGGYDERIDEISQQLAVKPNDPFLYFEMADAQVAHGEGEAALKSLKQVEKLAPGKFNTSLLQGSALLLVSQPAEARKSLDRYLEKKPQDIRGLALRAQAAKALGDCDSSLEDYRKALRVGQKPATELVAEAAEAFVSCEQPEEAATVLADGIQRIGPVPSLVIRAIDLEIANKQYDTALRLIETMRKSETRPEIWVAKRAGVLALADRKEESIVAWNELLAHISNLPALERGSAPMRQLTKQAQQALGITVNTPVIAPPAS